MPTMTNPETGEEVPDGVKSIESSTFEGCISLKKVVLGKE